jgi:hypothetical protein
LAIFELRLCGDARQNRWFKRPQIEHGFAVEQKKKARRQPAKG